MEIKEPERPYKEFEEKIGKLFADGEMDGADAVQALEDEFDRRIAYDQDEWYEDRLSEIRR